MSDEPDLFDEPAADVDGAAEADVTDEDHEADAPSGQAPVTVALLHPDASRRALLERKLQREGIAVVKSGGESDEVITEVIDDLPDVVAIFPGEALVEQVSRLEREAPAVSVLVLDPGPEHFAALGAGARGTLPSGGSEITKAVIGIARDETVLTPEWAGLLVEAIDALDDRVRRLALLNETEREVLGRRAEGETPRAIADAYEVSERLVNLHMGFAVGKYHRATEAVRTLDAFEAARDEVDETAVDGDDVTDDEAGLEREDEVEGELEAEYEAEFESELEDGDKGELEFEGDVDEDVGRVDEDAPDAADE